eukprot:1146098-Ditylum_brightwellii.AAC.1
MGHLQEAMTQLYKTSHGSSNASDDMPEVGLLATGGGITCFNCGEEGHKAFQCNKRSNGGNRQNNRRGGNCNKKCGNCEKTGHVDKDCWDDPKNKDKIPS